MAKIYVASSWRNKYYANVVDRLRAAGHEVYDFRHPPSVMPGTNQASAPVTPTNVTLSAREGSSPSAPPPVTLSPSEGSPSGFHWTDVDPAAANWTFAQYAAGLTHPLAERQFKNDIEALTWADTCVLVLPCGRSAHTEAGWMAGRGKKVIAYIPEMVEPELMYKLFDAVVGSLDELKEIVK